MKENCTNCKRGRSYGPIGVICQAMPVHVVIEPMEGGVIPGFHRIKRSPTEHWCGRHMSDEEIEVKAYDEAPTEKEQFYMQGAANLDKWLGEQKHIDPFIAIEDVLRQLRKEIVWRED